MHAVDEPEGLRVSTESVPEHGPRATVLLAGEETRGAFALVETLEVRGAEPPRHIHYGEDEALYVLEGSLDVWLAGGWVEAPAGAGVFVPRGVEHAFLVATGRARVLSWVAPAGFEGFYREMGALRSEVERLVAAAARYGCEITGPAPQARVADRDATGETQDGGGRAGSTREDHVRKSARKERP